MPLCPGLGVRGSLALVPLGASITEGGCQESILANTDTGGEFMFMGCQPTNKPGFQAPAEHELC
jgi:hypothetical protein